MFAQTATIYGSLGNFDVVNNTGQDACGFEGEIEGLPPGYPVGTFTVQRYGAATVTYRWLVNDAANPGSYVPVNPPIQIATAYYYIQQPAAALPNAKSAATHVT